MLYEKRALLDDVFSADTNKDPNAVMYKSLTYAEALSKELGIMDLTAFCLARDHNKTIRVFNLNKPGAMIDAVVHESEGTLIHC